MLISCEDRPKIIFGVGEALLRSKEQGHPIRVALVTGVDRSCQDARGLHKNKGGKSSTGSHKVPKYNTAEHRLSRSTTPPKSKLVSKDENDLRRIGERSTVNKAA